jgi:hypothetical protein
MNHEDGSNQANTESSVTSCFFTITCGSLLGTMNVPQSSAEIMTHLAGSIGSSAGSTGKDNLVDVNNNSNSTGDTGESTDALTASLPNWLRRRKSMMEIAISPQGLYLFYCNLSPSFVSIAAEMCSNSIKHILNVRFVDETKFLRSRGLWTGTLPKVLRTSAESVLHEIASSTIGIASTKSNNANVLNATEISTVLSQVQPHILVSALAALSWEHRSMQRLCLSHRRSSSNGTSNTDHTSNNDSGASALRVIPLNVWRKGFIIESLYLPLPVILASTQDHKSAHTATGTDNSSNGATVCPCNGGCSFSAYVNRVALIAPAYGCEVLYPNHTSTTSISNNKNGYDRSVFIIYPVPKTAVVLATEIRCGKDCVSVSIEHRAIDTIDILSSLFEGPLAQVAQAHTKSNKATTAASSTTNANDLNSNTADVANTVSDRATYLRGGVHSFLSRLMGANIATASTQAYRAFAQAGAYTGSGVLGLRFPSAPSGVNSGGAGIAFNGNGIDGDNINGSNTAFGEYGAITPLPWSLMAHPACLRYRRLYPLGAFGLLVQSITQPVPQPSDLVPRVQCIFEPQIGSFDISANTASYNTHIAFCQAMRGVRAVYVLRCLAPLLPSIIQVNEQDIDISASITERNTDNQNIFNDLQNMSQLGYNPAIIALGGCRSATGSSTSTIATTAAKISEYEIRAGVKSGSAVLCLRFVCDTPRISETGDIGEGPTVRRLRGMHFLYEKHLHEQEEQGVDSKRYRAMTVSFDANDIRPSSNHPNNNAPSSSSSSTTTPNINNSVWYGKSANQWDYNDPWLLGKPAAAVMRCSAHNTHHEKAIAAEAVKKKSHKKDNKDESKNDNKKAKEKDKRHKVTQRTQPMQSEQCTIALTPAPLLLPLSNHRSHRVSISANTTANLSVSARLHDQIRYLVWQRVFAETIHRKSVLIAAGKVTTLMDTLPPAGLNMISINNTEMLNLQDSVNELWTMMREPYIQPHVRNTSTLSLKSQPSHNETYCPYMLSSLTMEYLRLIGANTVHMTLLTNCLKAAFQKDICVVCSFVELEKVQLPCHTDSTTINEENKKEIEPEVEDRQMRIVLCHTLCLIGQSPACCFRLNIHPPAKVVINKATKSNNDLSFQKKQQKQEQETSQNSENLHLDHTAFAPVITCDITGFGCQAQSSQETFVKRISKVIDDLGEVLYESQRKSNVWIMEPVTK